MRGALSLSLTGDHSCGKRPVGAQTGIGFITNGGVGKLRMNCHMSPKDAWLYLAASVGSAQTEVHVMDKLALMLPPVGQPKTALTIDDKWTQLQLEAGYNYLFVQEDKSKGVHNMAYTTGLLKTSIAKLSAAK